jgi:hypothetical protein
MPSSKKQRSIKAMLERKKNEEDRRMHGASPL